MPGDRLPALRRFHTALPSPPMAALNSHPSFILPDLSRVPLTVPRRLNYAHAAPNTYYDKDIHILVLKTALLRLQMAQERVLLRLGSLQQTIATYDHAPIQRLPPDILLEVFSYLSNHGSSQETPAMKRQHMLPSHVCRQWRCLLLSTPHYWSVVIASVNGSDISNKLECTKAWISRSMLSPLTIAISCKSANVDREAAWGSLINTVIPHCRRWKRASILTLLDTDLSPIHNNIPMLESLCIAVPERHSIDAFEVAPKLHKVVVSNDQEFTAHATLPWAQITDLTVGGVNTRDCLTYLGMVPNIVSFTAISVQQLVHDSPSPHFHELKLKKLQILSITAECDVSRFFGSLHLPVLKELLYEDGPHGSGFPYAAVTSLLSRCSCPLESLRLHLRRRVGKEGLEIVLQYARHIKHLEIRSLDSTVDDSNALLDVLRHPSNNINSCLAPRLRSVSLQYDQNLNVHSLANLIESRWEMDAGPDSPISRVDMIELHHVDKGIRLLEWEERLRLLWSFIIEGLRVDVRGVRKGGTLY